MYQGAWISPKGKIIDLEFITHFQYMKDYPKEFGLTREDINRMSEDEARIYALQKGWIRIRISKYQRMFIITIELDEITPKSLGDIAYYLASSRFEEEDRINIYELKWRTQTTTTVGEILKGELEKVVRNFF